MLKFCRNRQIPQPRSEFHGMQKTVVPTDCYDYFTTASWIMWLIVLFIFCLWKLCDVAYLKAVESGRLRLIPEHYEKQWSDWLSNTRLLLQYLWFIIIYIYCIIDFILPFYYYGLLMEIESCWIVRYLFSEVRNWCLIFQWITFIFEFSVECKSFYSFAICLSLLQSLLLLHSSGQLQ